MPKFRTFVVVGGICGNHTNHCTCHFDLSGKTLHIRQTVIFHTKNSMGISLSWKGFGCTVGGVGGGAGFSLKPVGPAREGLGVVRSMLLSSSLLLLRICALANCNIETGDMWFHV